MPRTRRDREALQSGSLRQNQEEEARKAMQNLLASAQITFPKAG